MALTIEQAKWMLNEWKFEVWKISEVLILLKIHAKASNETFLKEQSMQLLELLDTTNKQKISWWIDTEEFENALTGIKVATIQIAEQTLLPGISKFKEASLKNKVAYLLKSFDTENVNHLKYYWELVLLKSEVNSYMNDTMRIMAVDRRLNTIYANFQVASATKAS
jgi:hypothetical protein